MCVINAPCVGEGRRIGAHTSVRGGRRPLLSSGILPQMSHRSKAAPAQSCLEKFAQGKLFRES